MRAAYEAHGACKDTSMTTGMTITGHNPFSTWESWSSSSPSLNPHVTTTSDEEWLAFSQNTMNTCYKWLDRVVRLCQQPRLNLKVSPPYLLDLLPDTYEKLQTIVHQYRDDYMCLSQIEYFRIFVRSVTQHSRRTVRLFHKARDSIFDVHSLARSRLVKLTLVFSHLLHDLRAMFPANTFVASAFRITKPDAAKWWSQSFGSRSIVPWSVFESALSRRFHVDSRTQLEALRTTIDLTCNAHVSVFEFDVFTRLFQPWTGILETWKVLAVVHPGYMAFMTYDQVKAVLRQFRSRPGAGSYVFRLSCTKPGQWAIGYVTTEGKILQTIIQNKSLVQALLDGEREGFYRYPNGQSSPSALLHQLVQNLPQQHLQVTQEQYQVYCEIGSAFELCKICDENNKDVQLQPCGHLICKHCLLSCQSAGYNQTCPFCRLEIKGIEDVIVEPYKPAATVHSPIPTVSNHISSATVSFRASSPIDTTVVFGPRKPPPVPPRTLTPLTLVPSVTSSGMPSDTLPLPISRVDCQSGLFCYPNMMYANGCCLVSVSSDERDLCSSSVPTTCTRIHSTLPHTKSSIPLNYAELDLAACESDADWSEEGGSGLSCTTPGSLALSADASDRIGNRHMRRFTKPYRSLSCPNTTPADAHDDAERLVQRLLTTHKDMDRSSALLLLSITHNQVHMIEQIWQHFIPRTKESTG